jgi:hypothetical protein
LNESRRPILSDAPSLHVPLPRHPRVSRRARSGGMSRIALVSACRQADNDKTRVSSIYKRRVTPVPEEAAASTEASCCWARPSGLERGWMAPLEVWTRKVAGSGCATSPSFSSRRDSGAPDARVGAVSRGCRRCDVDCHPVASSSRFRGPPTIEVPRGADPGGPLPSGPVPAPSLRSWRSAGSSPAGTALVRPPHRQGPDSPDLSQAACTSPGTPHDDAIPVDRVSSSVRLRAHPMRPR